jgi:endonuclease/exonuclease/phosphatase family metal-dependent hydrolase
MARLRFASFNVENLFSRARVLNLSDHAVAAGTLAEIGRLDRLLRKASYSAADKRDILELLRDLGRYVFVREDRGKLLNFSKSKVTASGAGSWDGALEFRRAKFSEMARENTAKVLKAIDADVACIVEAEDRPSLWAFNQELLDSKKLARAMLIDGNDERGIDVGILCDLAIRGLKTHIFDGAANDRTFSRDCLRVELAWTAKRSLHVLCNHFKSKSGGEAKTDPRRERQARAVRAILGDYDLERDWVIVAGDLNDTPDRPPLRPLLDVPHLHDVLALQFPGQPEKRWTYHYDAKEQIDYVLVSKPLKAAFVAAGVERRGIFDLAKITGGAEQSFPSVTKKSDAASDHGAVWAEFEL